MATKNQFTKTVKLSEDNHKRLEVYRKKTPFCPNIQTIVNFALETFLDTKVPKSNR